MNEHVQALQKKRLARVKAALEKNRMEAYIVDSAAEVAPLVKSFLKQGDVISDGGSATLGECGLYELFQSGGYEYLNRNAAPPEQKPEIARRALLADWYFASANAVAETGEIVEMDGNGNRVAAITFGPGNVVLVVGRNKIEPTLEAARARVRWTAAPANAQRFGLSTPCGKTGLCADCSSPERICSFELILHYQRVANRIRVILVDQDLGF